MTSSILVHLLYNTITDQVTVVQRSTNGRDLNEKKVSYTHYITDSLAARQIIDGLYLSARQYQRTEPDFGPDFQFEVCGISLGARVPVIHTT